MGQREKEGTQTLAGKATFAQCVFNMANILNGCWNSGTSSCIHEFGLVGRNIVPHCLWLCMLENFGSHWTGAEWRPKTIKCI